MFPLGLHGTKQCGEVVTVDFLYIFLPTVHSKVLIISWKIEAFNFLKTNDFVWMGEN